MSLRWSSQAATKARFSIDGTMNFWKQMQEFKARKNNSWAIRWYASAFLENNYCLYPGVSLVQNIGIDGSGTHNGISDRLNVHLSQKKITVSKIDVREDITSKKKIIAYFHDLRKNNISFTGRVKRKIKGLLKKMSPDKMNLICC